MIRFAPDAPALREETGDRPKMTMAATACLRRIERTGGRLIPNHRGPPGWRVVSPTESVLYWFPPDAGRRLVALRMVDDDGRMTRAGFEELERYDR